LAVKEGTMKRCAFLVYCLAFLNLFQPARAGVKGLSAVVDLDIEYPTTTQRGSAVGVLVDGRGDILSAYAPLKEATRVRVALGDGRILEARPAGSDPATGLALLTLAAPKELPAALKADTKAASVGQALTLPSILRRGHRAVSDTVVVATGREVELGQGRTLSGLLQIDSSGEPGAPLLGRKGELVGICVYAPSDTLPMAFALPAERALKAYTKLRAGRR
jgi:S1-C subfamily serine protease